MNLFQRVKSKFHRMLHGFDSARYWEQRYAHGGNSGAGSYDRLADFKARIINAFVKENDIKSIVEWGVGDGNQLKLMRIPSYHGLDVSPSTIKSTKSQFIGDSSKTFQLVSDFRRNPRKFEMSISLDVIYHLIENAVFHDYMLGLFQSSTKFVLIYSSNEDDPHYLKGHHVKHRKFTDWVVANAPNWRLANQIPNEYPFDPSNPDHTSFADFYIFEKI